jgi:oxalyl-CoA decarboxylase
MDNVTTARKDAAPAVAPVAPATGGAQPNAQPKPEIDGFNLLIEALKLNGIDTIFGLPGIPITDLTRKAQAAGIRVISFRHEQNAGYAASIAGFMTQKPGICLTVSAPGFLNGLTSLANATTNCFPMILISGSSEREVVDLQQGDYEEMDQLAIAKPLAKAAFRVLHADDIGIGVARAIRAAVSGRPGGVYLDLPAKLFPQSIDAETGRNSLIKVVDPAPRQIPAPESVARALELLKGAKRPLIIVGKGAAYAQADADIRALIEKTGIPYLPMAMAKGLLPDTHEQSPLRRARMCSRSRRRDADRRASQLAAVARQGQDVGRQELEAVGRAEVHPDRHLAAGGRQQRAHRCAGGRRHRQLRVGAARGHRSGWSRPPADWTGAIAERKTKNIAKMAETLAKNPSPMNFHSALAVVRDIIKANPSAMLVNEGANALDFTRSIVDMYQPRRRLDVGTWGVMGIGMGFSIAAAVVSGEQVIAVEGDSAFRLLGHGSRDDLPLQAAGLRGDPQQQRRLSRRRSESDRRPGPLSAGVRQGRSLREADGGVRRCGRPRDDTRRIAQGAGRGRAVAAAHADQRHH